MTIDMLYEIIASDYAIAIFFSFTGSLLMKLSRMNNRTNNKPSSVILSLMVSTFAGANMGMIFAGLMQSEFYGNFLIGGSGLLGAMGYKKIERVFIEIFNRIHE